ncbi:MAG TPA: ABC transporter permease, partial [Candidatus Acidoferrales bacterium]|nr:ABC transporter permease [Candidatus Acidoferrales bacterium]
PENTLQPLDKIDGIQNYSKLICTPQIINVDGSQLKVAVYGYDLNSGVGIPWSMASGNIDDLRQNDTIIVDQSIEAKFNRQLTGDSISVSDLPQKVVGISKDSKWFTFPLVFTSYENAAKLSRVPANMTNYALVNVKPNYDPLKVSKEISATNGADAFITSQIRDNTVHWLIFDSGAGMGLLIGAGVGWVVAAIIVTLTIYTVTIERIPEFGTIKAIGASKKDIYKILLEQVFVSVTLGYTVGVICSFIAAAAIMKITLLPITIGLDTLTIAFFLTLILSILGSLISARKVNKVDPAIVFRA